MQFMSLAIPPESEGADYSGEEVIVVPDQALSLEEILRRYTIGEPIDSHDTSYDDDLSDGDDFSDPNIRGVDLEKVKHLDLVDREEFVNSLKRTRETYEAQLRQAKTDEEKIRLENLQKDEEKRIRIAARKLAKQNSQSQQK